MSDELLKISEASERLRLGRSLFYDLLRRGEIRSISIGRARRIPVSAIREFIERKEEEARGVEQG
jgi:excisionase family DNA binding protein